MNDSELTQLCLKRCDQSQDEITKIYQRCSMFTTLLVVVAAGVYSLALQAVSRDEPLGFLDSIQIGIAIVGSCLLAASCSYLFLAIRHRSGEEVFNGQKLINYIDQLKEHYKTHGNDTSESYAQLRSTLNRSLQESAAKAESVNKAITQTRYSHIKNCYQWLMAAIVLLAAQAIVHIISVTIS